MKLWLLRHAKVMVESGLCYGASDLVCDPVATEAAAQAFAPQPSAQSVIWTSSSQRAIQLAEAIRAQRPDLQGPCMDERLCEMNFGVWEMTPWSEIPRHEYDVWVQDFADYRFGGRESTQEVIHRVSEALDDARKSGHQEMVWVTHAGVIKAVQYLLSPASKKMKLMADAWPADSVELGGWVGIKIPRPDHEQ